MAAESRSANKQAELAHQIRQELYLRARASFERRAKIVADGGDYPRRILAFYAVGWGGMRRLANQMSRDLMRRGNRFYPQPNVRKQAIAAGLGSMSKAERRNTVREALQGNPHTDPPVLPLEQLPYPTHLDNPEMPFIYVAARGLGGLSLNVTLNPGVTSGRLEASSSENTQVITARPSPGTLYIGRPVGQEPDL